MTAEEFAEKFPKPWHFVTGQASFSLKAANGSKVANLQLSNRHKGIPQAEWNRHVAAALKTPEIPVIPEI